MRSITKTNAMNMNAKYQKALSKFKELESTISLICQDNYSVAYNKNGKNNSKVFNLKDLNRHLIK